MLQRTGETLQGERGRYRAYEMVGAGGSGTVFYGLQLATNRPVAVKRLHEHFLYQPRMVARFEREAALVLDRGLEHPNLVRILDRGRDARTVPFLIMEWVEGWTVASLLAEHGGRLTVPAAASIGCQALEGLGWAHSRGVVHRDVKPANLMVTREGNVRVMDLGIAKETDPDIASSISSSTNLGTWTYAAPEHIAGDRPLDGRVDIFALGATLYDVLAGRPPFNGPGRDRLPPNLDVVRPDIPPGLSRVVHRALAIEASHRFQTADEMRRELSRFAPADLRVPVPEASPTATVSLPPQALASSMHPWLANATELAAGDRLDDAVALLAETYDQGLPEAAAPYAETLWTRADRREQTGDVSGALDDYRMALDVTLSGPLHEELALAEELVIRRQRLAELISAVRARHAAGDWEGVIDLVSQIHSVAPDNSDSDELLADAQQHLTRVRDPDSPDQADLLETVTVAGDKLPATEPAEVDTHRQASFPSEISFEQILSTIALDPLAVRRYFESHPSPPRAGGLADESRRRQPTLGRAGAQWQGLVSLLLALVVGAIALSAPGTQAAPMVLLRLIVGGALLAPVLFWAITRNRRSGRWMAWAALGVLLASAAIAVLQRFAT